MPSTLSEPQPSATLIVREKAGRVYYEAKFRYRGAQVMRRIGPAWLEPDGGGSWRKRKGRTADGFHDQRSATLAAAELVAAYVKDATEVERVERERMARGITFRQVASDYMHWLEHDYEAKPATLKNYGYALADNSRIIRALGDRPAGKIGSDEIRALLAAISESGAGPRTVNLHRNMIRAIFNYGMKRAVGYRLTANPAVGIDSRREREPGVLAFYTPAEVEAVARALTAGRHRTGLLRPGTDGRLRREPIKPSEDARNNHERAEDAQDGEAVRIAAYSGLRQGELLELRWADIDWHGSALTISRARSANTITSPKSRKVRRVPMADPAARALERLSRRDDFTSPDELVLVNAFGRAIDGSALRKRFQRAATAVGLRKLTWHHLRHTFGSQLVATGIDLVTVQDALGHAQLSTTSRYLHARPATETAGMFSRAFAAGDALPALPARRMLR
jgi:integrase